MIDLVSNRKALHDYEILETLEAGIALVGTEVKSLREHHGSLTDAFVIFEGEEAILFPPPLPPIDLGISITMRSDEKESCCFIKKKFSLFKGKGEEKGLTIIPFAFYLKKGKIKVRLAVVKGKKQHDKRAATKEREVKREIDRAMKEKEMKVQVAAVGKATERMGRRRNR